MSNQKPAELKKKGTLIAVEGISGCGKSGKVKSLHMYFRKTDFNTYIVEWNSNSIIRGAVSFLREKKLLNSTLYSVLQWLDFLLSYFFIIKPKLKKGYIIIADRYIYTGLTRDAANGALLFLGKLISKFVRKPDMIFFYDVPPEICICRISKRGKPFYHTNKLILNNKLLKHKDLYYLTKLRNEYLKIFTNFEKEEKKKLLFINEENVGKVSKKAIKCIEKG
jgi:dTMP kinase